MSALRVVVAHSGFTDTDIEQEVVGSLGATVEYVGNLETPQALEAARGCAALLVTVQQVTAEIINSMEHCKVITRVGTGVDSIDIAAATARGIWVTNVTDYAIDEVSAHAIALMMLFARRLVPMMNAVKEGVWWDPAHIGTITRLSDQTFGVIGYGRIGRKTAARAAGLGMRVLAYTGNQRPADPGVTMVDLDTLLRESDYISLHLPLTERTRNIIDAAALAKMKPTAVLINTARGLMVDENALLHAIRSGRLAGAALDVLVTEPPAPDSPLLQDPRIVLTPHGAWYSEESKREVRLKAIQDVARVLRGERPHSPVNDPTAVST